MHETMASVASLEKIEIIRSQEFMPSKARLKFLKKKIILGPKTAILGPQFCRILVLGPHFWWSGGPGPPGPLLDPPLIIVGKIYNFQLPTDVFILLTCAYYIMLKFRTARMTRVVILRSPHTRMAEWLRRWT